MTIKILPPELASQIAAGEVVERPASVVKELIENSLDAGSTQITILIFDAGKKLIEVKDNGCGIPERELVLAAERHATSKLFNAEQLSRISTLGFRGEALASIASISQLEIKSRTIDSETGGVVVIQAGKTISNNKVGMPPGTTVKVQDLFQNVPARKKFLKHDRTERSQIQRVVERYALANVNVKFSLTMEGRVSFRSSGNGNQREILGKIFDVETARNLLEVISRDGELIINGFTSGPAISRSNRRAFYFFINQRPVQDPSISAAVMKAYQNVLMVKRYPICLLFIYMPEDSVDVNVHPTKAEVRFRDQDKIFTGIQAAVRRALLAHSPVPDLNLTPNWFHKTSVDQIQDPSWHFDRRIPESSDVFPHSDEQTKDNSSFTEQEDGLHQQAFRATRMNLLKPVGQLAATYLVAEGPDGMYLIDQHAAHERILFEQLSMDRTQPIPFQTLLQPVTTDLNENDAQIILEYLPHLNNLGFQVESFGERSFIIRAIPHILGDMDPMRALDILVEDFEEDEVPLENHLQNKLIARICKRASIKAGKVLSNEEQRALISDLEACKSPRTCPHGRPTMIHLSVDLLERQFGRKGAR